MKQRLDKVMVERGLVVTRSQAESYIRLKKVIVDGQVVKKPGFLVGENTEIRLTQVEQYVSRAGMKLASVAADFHLDFRGKVVLDVGSSTGGFTDYALKHGAVKVIAVDVGTDQLHPSLRGDSRIELYEQKDIRDMKKTSSPVDIVVIDVSFVSLTQILPAVKKLATTKTQVVAMCKPQFEARAEVAYRHKGIIKNEAMRRDILKQFEYWVKQHFVLLDKKDSDIHGEKGNHERFYLLQLLKVG